MCMRMSHGTISQLGIQKDLGIHRIWELSKAIIVKQLYPSDIVWMINVVEQW